jgi:hypothetical protein
VIFVQKLDLQFLFLFHIKQTLELELQMLGPSNLISPALPRILYAGLPALVVGMFEIDLKKQDHIVQRHDWN